MWEVCPLACPALATRALNLASEEATVVVLFGFCCKAEDVKRKTIAPMVQRPSTSQGSLVTSGRKADERHRLKPHPNRRSPWSLATLGDGRLP
jgi:hypothetical protein